MVRNVHRAAEDSAALAAFSSAGRAFFEVTELEVTALGIAGCVKRPDLFAELGVDAGDDFERVFFFMSLACGSLSGPAARRSLICQVANSDRQASAARRVVNQILVR